MEKGLRFYGLLDFFPNKEKIKEEYDKLTLDEVIAYKKEVYSICFEREYIKDLIWEYLNEWEESQDNLEREWKTKRDKMIQRLRDENNRGDNNDVDS